MTQVWLSSQADGQQLSTIFPYLILHILKIAHTYLYMNYQQTMFDPILICHL